MIRTRVGADGTKRYQVLVKVDGKQRSFGTFERRRLAEKREREVLTSPVRSDLTARQWYEDHWLPRKRDRLARRSVTTYETRMKPFLADYGERKLSDLERLDRDEAAKWARKHRTQTESVVTFFRDAIDADKIARNPFRGLASKGPGRRDLEPLSIEELDRLAECAASAFPKSPEFGKTMRSFVLFMAYSTFRTGEMLGLEWRDIDFDEMRIRVRRQVTHGETKLPKGDRQRIAYLLPEARDALLPLKGREGRVFRAKLGGPLSGPNLAMNWQTVTAAFGQEIDPYALRHFGGWFFYVELDRASRVVAAQMGNSPAKVEQLYGHFKHGAMDDIERAVEARTVSHLRSVG